MKVALPMLLVGLVVGLVVSVFQAVTQIQEQTLSFIPKIARLVVVIVVAAVDARPVVDWTEELYGQIPTLVGA
jgi:flagellar biosynthetic protein FliQ